MTTDEHPVAYEITWLIRRLFRTMGDTAEDYLSDVELTASERAVMEFLYPDERLSVPEIATRYKDSRQHVQVTVNSLLQKGLLRAEPNPRHKRSPLLRLGDLGRKTFAEIRANEVEIIDRLFRGVSKESLETTHASLRTLYKNLRREKRNRD